MVAEPGQAADPSGALLDERISPKVPIGVRGLAMADHRPPGWCPRDGSRCRAIHAFTSLIVNLTRRPVRIAHGPLPPTRQS